MTARFTVHTTYSTCRLRDQRRRWLRVTVHDTVEDLRASATRHRGTDGEFTDALGCFQPAPHRERYDRRKRAWVYSGTGYVGVLRLTVEDLNADLICHEVVHAAAHAARTTTTDHNVELGTDCDQPEEDFAYLTGDLMGQVVLRLHQLHLI